MGWGGIRVLFGRALDVGEASEKLLKRPPTGGQNIFCPVPSRCVFALRVFVAFPRHWGLRGVFCVRSKVGGWGGGVVRVLLRRVYILDVPGYIPGWDQHHHL